MGLNPDISRYFIMYGHNVLMSTLIKFSVTFVMFIGALVTVCYGYFLKVKSQDWLGFSGLILTFVDLLDLQLSLGFTGFNLNILEVTTIHYTPPVMMGKCCFRCSTLHYIFLACFIFWVTFSKTG